MATRRMVICHMAGRVPLLGPAHRGGPGPREDDSGTVAPSALNQASSQTHSGHSMPPKGASGTRGKPLRLVALASM